MVRAVQQIEAEHGAVDVLINNAGYSQTGALEEIPIDRLRKQLETNVFGLMRLTQLVLPGMRRHGSGKIVNIGSMGGKLTFPGGGAYHATKHAVEAPGRVPAQPAPHAGAARDRRTARGAAESRHADLRDVTAGKAARSRGDDHLLTNSHNCLVRTSNSFPGHLLLKE